MSLSNQLENELAKTKGIPFLFVGSGLSRRYLQLEDWSSLLKQFAIARDFDYYLGKADSNLPKVATEIAQDFFEIWWSDDYKALRESIAVGPTTKEDCLKYAIAKYVGDREASQIDKAFASKEVEALKSASIDGIITTNWDQFLDKLFPDFKVYVGQQELLVHCPQGIAEIYKIHGCCKQPSSMVLTAADYDVFEKRNPYLAAKLVTLFIERPIIFLGYSLTDSNIQQLLGSIIRGIGHEYLNKLQNKLIFVQRDGDNQGDSIMKSTYNIGDGVLPVTVVRTNDFSQVYNATLNLKREYPTRVLRTLKKQVYELVKNVSPSERIAVVDIEKLDDYSNLEVVMGVGLIHELGRQGYVPIGRLALLKDVFSDETSYDPKSIVDDVLPRLLRQATYVPVFKYARQAGIRAASVPDLDEKTSSALGRSRDFFAPPKQYLKRRKEVECLSIEALRKKYNADCVHYLSLIKKPVLEDLRDFCLECFEEYTGTEHHSLRQTSFVKLCCLYDYLKWGEGSKLVGDTKKAKKKRSAKKTKKKSRKQAGAKKKK